jgi:hypothetical protein
MEGGNLRGIHFLLVEGWPVEKPMVRYDPIVGSTQAALPKQ